MIRRVAILALLLSSLATAQDPAQPVPQPGPRTGVVAGIIRDIAGLPLGDARISIDSGVMFAFSAPDGSYRIDRVPVGPHTIEGRKPGYRPTNGRIVVTQDTLLTVNIRLNRSPAALPQVLIQAERVSSLSGTVADTSGAPLTGVIVEAMGFGEWTETDAEGRFMLTDLKPGVYLVQWRKKYYAVAQYGLTLEAKEQLRFNVKLGLAEKELTTSADLAAIVAQEATRRIGMKGAKAMVVSRAELERFGTTRLDAALLESSGGQAFREVRQSCALIDGHEQLSTESNVTIDPGVRRNRAPTSIAALSGGRAAVARDAPPPPSPRPLTAPGSWISHVQADEVEMVEIYPEGSENSRTLCGRFRPSSGCSCPPSPSGVVIWTRK